MKDSKENDLITRLKELEHRIDELTARIEKQTELFLDEDLKARGLK